MYRVRERGKGQIGETIDKGENIEGSCKKLKEEVENVHVTYLTSGQLSLSSIKPLVFCRPSPTTQPKTQLYYTVNYITTCQHTRTEINVTNLDVSVNVSKLVK